MFGIGAQELLVILMIVLFLFGATKIPQLARSLGKGIGEFRKGQREGEEETPVKGTATCPFCHKSTPAGAPFCSQCGGSLAAGTVCGSCGRALKPDEKYCPGCGRAVG